MDSEKREPVWQKRQLILALVTTALLAVVLGTLAWFQYTKKLQTITEVHVPNLWLKGANGQDISTVNLGEIDVEDGTFSRTYVFAVASDEKNPFFLQLAHTTNIPFKYTIYNAQEIKITEDNVEKVSYQIGDAVSGGYVNAYENGEKLAIMTEVKDGVTVFSQTHLETYGNYDRVQKNAEPLYWKSVRQEFTQTKKPFISYYILEVSWGSAEGTNVHNTKETDMIYLMAITDGTTQSGQ